MALFSIIMPIYAPIVEAQGFFSFGKKNKAETVLQKELPPISREKLVAILIQEELLETSLKNKIERYAHDVQNELQARAILIPIPQNASPLEIQEGLAQFYFSGYKNDNKSQLIGTVLIGDVVIPVVDKNGGLNPAIFPYVDFEDVNYKWNYESKRFTWVGGDNEPEIWHGLIRSDVDDFDSQVAELEKYFEKNHQVHTQNTTYSKKVFFADFYRQRLGTSEKQKEFYENWINHLGDFVYLRFNKHWLKNITEEQISEVPDELLPSFIQGQNQSMDFSQMPDVFAKNPIETMSMQYLSANENILSQINEQIESAGRWNSREIDTTISLISKKDEWAANILKSATDEIEEIFIQKANDLNLASTITISKDTSINYDCEIAGIMVLNGCTKYFPNNWLGIAINNDFSNWNWRTEDYLNSPDYPAENCSLYRGTVRTEENKIAQKVEISRVFNPYKYEDNPDDRCYGDVQGDNVNYSKCRLSGYISDMNTNNSVLINDDWDMVGGWEYKVEKPVFEMTGSREVFDTKYDGASACEPVILELQADDEIRKNSTDNIEFSSLMVHNEPTVDTIRSMVKNVTATSMPIDPHHGISFYDHYEKDANDKIIRKPEFHRINFPSAFDLINKRDELAENFEILTKAELEQNLVNTINQLNATAGNAGKIQESFFADSYWMQAGKQKELIEAIKWLGTDLEKKNIEMFTGAISAKNKAKSVLKQSNYNGYELIEIRGELSDIEPNGGIKVAFERGQENPSNVFIEAKNTGDFEGNFLNNINNSNKSEEINLGNSELQAEFEEIFAESQESSNCSGNLLTWSTSCLIPWIAELPNMLGNITKLESNLDIESESKIENPAKNEKSSFSLIPVSDSAMESSLAKIEAAPSLIKISNNDTFPQEIVVLLKDLNGKILSTDYLTEIELIPENSDVDDFFAILPSTKVIAKKGRAVFHLIPKGNNYGGSVNFKFRGNSVESNNINIQISTKKIEASVNKNKLIAGDNTGATISAKIFDKEGQIDHSFDGSYIIFSAKQGKFYSEDSSSNRSKIKNGVAEILFFPGIKSGEIIIKVVDEEDVLPRTQIDLEIIPAAPSAITIKNFQDKLVVNGDALPYFAGIYDNYGNEIKGLEKEIKWKLSDNLKIENKKNGKINLQYKKQDKSLLKNVIKVINGKSRENNSENIKLSAEISYEKEIINLSKFREILLTKSPSFEAIIPELDLLAGDSQPLSIKIIAKTESGEILKNNFTAQVINDNPLIGKVSQEIYFDKGVANLNVFAGFKSGTLNIKILANGFIPNNFSLKVKPADSHVIKLSTENLDINADSVNNNELKIEVLDKYGNLANFNGEINLLLNPQEYIEDYAQNLKDLEIFSNPSRADSLAQNQQSINNQDFTLNILSFENNTVNIANGIGSVNFLPVGLGGKAYIKADSDELISGTIELDVTKVLSTTDLKYLSPKSLLAMMLGFAGGDFNEKNMGNRFLFDGETQAVATTISENSAKKIVGHIFSDGKISENLKPQIFAGNKFEVLLSNYAKAVFNYKKEPNFYVGKKDIKDEAVYFQINKELELNDFDLKSREIIYQESPLFKITKQGGVLLNNSKIKFESINNSLFNWKVYLEEVFIGSLYFNIENAKVIERQFNKENIDNSIEIEVLNTSLDLAHVFNGKTTTEEKGIAIFSKTELEDENKKLGSSNFDSGNQKLGWTTDWKAGSFFAGKNTIGNSTKWGSGDSFILLGDPSLSIQTENIKSDLNLTKDLGTPIWRSSLGVIDDIITGDMNFDNRSEIFIRTGENITALYQDENNLGNFRNIGKILRFGDGAKKVVSYNKNNGDLIYIIQINDKGKLIFHHNINGKFSREKIDLGLKNPIENIEVANFNSDEFKDLVLLDNSNNLYFVYGKDDGFYSAQLLDSTASSFENVSENYITTDGQNTNNKILNPAKFKNLNNFFVGFLNSNTQSWTGNLKKIGDLDFLPVTENKAFNIKFEMNIGGGNAQDNLSLKVKNGTEFTQKLTLYSQTENLYDFQLIIPNFAGFEIDYASLSVSNCNGTPNIQKKNESFMITGCNIKSNELVNISWKLKTIKIPVTNFVVEDFEGNDGIDDIVIPWEIDGKKKFIQYLSYGTPKSYPQNSAKKTIDAPASPIKRTHVKKIVSAFPDGSVFPTEDFDAQDSSQEMFDCLKNSENGLPPLYQTLSVDDLLLNISGKAGFAGLQIPSIAFLAPGPQSIYIPPFSFPNPMPSMGNPVLWVGPTPPYVGSMSGQYPGSMFRLYLMPTTTLRLGIGICGGPIVDPLMTATGSPFPPQCFVIVPPLSASSSINENTGNGSDSNGNNSTSNNCVFENPANSSELNKSNNDFLLNSFANSGAGFNLGSFNLSIGSYSKNLQIASPDIISEWVKAQMKEFSNFKFPRFDIIMPKFRKSQKGDKKLKPLEKLSQSPYFEIKKEKLEINYPSFSREKLEKLNINIGSWKKENLKTKESLKLQLLELDNYDFAGFNTKIEEYRLNINEKISVEIILPSLDGLSVDLKSSINKEIQSIKNKKSILKNKINQKLDKLKNAPEEVLNSAKNKIQEQLDEIEKIESIMDKNLKALKSYQEEINKLKKVPEKIKKSVKELEKINDVIKNYWETWTEKNKKAAQEWKNFEKKTTATIKTWNEVPKIFKDFTSSCTAGGGGGGTSVNRGTMLTWLTKIIFSAIKLPVIPMPQFPDTEIDLSKIKIGASLILPEISFQPVKVSLPELPRNLNIEINAKSLVEKTLGGALQGISSQIGVIPNLVLDSLDDIERGADLALSGKNLNASLESYSASLSGSLGTVNGISTNFAGNLLNQFPVINMPSIPTLPIIPMVVPEIKIPAINLPQLPTLISPPEFPNLLQPIISIISVIKPLVQNIMCNLSLGIIPIPEWKVASRVVQLTNRTSLLPMDFVFSAQLPGIPKGVLPTIKIAPPIKLVPAFDQLNIAVKGMAQTMNNLTNMMSAMTKGGLPSMENLAPVGSPLSQIKKDNTYENFAKLVKISIHDEIESLGEIDNTKVLLKIREIAKNKNEFKINFKEKDELSNLDKKLLAYRGLRAERGFISSNNTPDNLPENFDTSPYELKNVEPEPIKKLYYYSSLKNKAESITIFPVDGSLTQLEIADLDEDNEEEILYSLNNQLFMKKLVDKNLADAEKENIYSVPNNLIYQNFAEFSAYFAPALEYDSKTNSSESDFEFLPPKSREISYFEWIISDRPDRIFELNVKSHEKSSEEWNRIGFLIRPKGHKYEIRQGAAEIKKITGNPVLYGNKLNDIAKFSTNECSDDKITKPFFSKETILVGIDTESKFKVRTKKRFGQQVDEIFITLRSGEETIVDFAEICLTKGAIKYIDLDKIEKFIPKPGDHFFSNMRFELGRNDKVELSLFNDTQINIYGGEKYELYSFNSRENFIGHIKKLSLGNYYGQFIGFNSQGKSFTYSKDLLHDPQLGDDKELPEIIITQGNKIVAFITQKIKIDASESYDNQKISRVWWERDGKIFLDSNDEKYSVTQLLNIEIPAKNTPQTFFVTLNIEDESGNIATQEIPVKVIVPNLELSDVSLRDQEILGKIKEGVSGFKVGFLRERNGRKDILEKTVLSGDNGRFVMENLANSGNILLKDRQTKKIIAEILETGRPIINNKKEANSKITKTPFAIKIFDSSSENLAVLNLKTDEKNDIKINSFIKEISANLAINSNEIQVVDSNSNDNFVWKSFSDGVVFKDNLNNKTIGILNNNGQFTTTDYLKNLAIQPKKAESEDDPLIFQIYNDKNIIAEFFIPIKEIIVQ